MTYWNVMFKEWQDIQQQFLNNLPLKLANIGCQQPTIRPWELPQLQTFMTWGQSAVKQSMELQTHWLDQWANQVDTLNISSLNKDEMIERLQDSMNSWNENQSDLWTYWFKMVEDTAGSMDDASTLFDNLNKWKSTVDESLSSQSNWLEQWPKEINFDELSPDQMLNVINQVQETMNGWLALQAELWKQWFDFVDVNEIDSSSFTTAPLNEKEKPVNPTDKTTAKQEPTKVTRQAKATPKKKKPATKTTTKATKQTTVTTTQKAKEPVKETPKTTPAAKEKMPIQRTKKVESKATKSTVKKPAVSTKDNLEEISGIGPALAKKLYEKGIVTFQQIADLSEEDIDQLEETIIKFPGRIRREKWVSQATDLLS